MDQINFSNVTPPHNLIMKFLDLNNSDEDEDGDEGGENSSDYDIFDLVTEILAEGTMKTVEASKTKWDDLKTKVYGQFNFTPLHFEGIILETIKAIEEVKDLLALKKSFPSQYC
ncbi:15311_t:CDS:2 [Entrophospora sp. SA101]|nr:15311_t:CDS:2 [Entrophospora sp. SA101]